MTEQIKVAQSAGSNRVATETADLILAVAGTSGKRAATASSAAANVGQLVAVTQKP